MTRRIGGAVVALLIALAGAAVFAGPAQAGGNTKPTVSFVDGCDVVAITVGSSGYKPQLVKISSAGLQPEPQWVGGKSTLDVEWPAEHGDIEVAYRGQSGWTVIGAHDWVSPDECEPEPTPSATPEPTPEPTGEPTPEPTVEPTTSPGDVPVPGTAGGQDELPLTGSSLPALVALGGAGLAGGGLLLWFGRRRKPTANVD